MPKPTDLPQNQVAVSNVSMRRNESSSSLQSHSSNVGTGNGSHVLAKLFRKGSDRSSPKIPSRGASMNNTPSVLTPTSSNLTPRVSKSSNASTAESTDSSSVRHLSLKRFLKPIQRSAKAKEQQEHLQQVIQHKLNKLKIGNHHHHHKEQPRAEPLLPPQPDGHHEGAVRKLVAHYGEIPDAAVEKSVLGEGAGGSVLIVRRPSDGQVFAIKKFRPRTSRESDYEYRKKVINEYNLLVDLDHENIIRVYELLNEHTLYVMVMEYCAYDFFTIVMGGVMLKDEIYCYFKQMAEGVLYLHSQGIAHRDLKLDNCVVNEEGILKLVDFGSASRFRMPDSDPDQNIIPVRGVVGSDPYLAPECLSMGSYDPRPADVWSLAIMFCCMVLRRFPWKIPKTTDSSFRAFIGEPGDEGKASSGSGRLLKLLPAASRPLIGAMLMVAVDKRITMDGLQNDAFFNGIDWCHSSIKGDHTHHLITEKDLERIEAERRKQSEMAKKMG
ncbi:hypothetical protein KL930_004351 [Ogataea haglerorum]|uniref:uncharacterized protein n=1 Tax=Ogataea haglerorum TaxID=1937702 RepID=UPI001C8A46D0|nr:uncharacterized protein KL911_004162 [Ogataea haglerorum]KAG7704328.1 hypothetical protein KL914_004315 [Ogataea haglerorum]KAG7704514.1 hypothetical protein KL950_004321 [Ogataea haglerorum]KAG7715865.1 hypothetical protein KL913_003678 [Ogataea haglerorum]KAG7716570.1 hypothetical protein KL949_003861 [Ogataea haglerorum]KAG7738166.1 hypothetical protein KL932_003773 [Ogataea haglerorum]